MTLPIFQQQSIEMHDAKYVVLPPWKGGEDAVVRSLVIPDVYVLDTSQKYPIGTKFVDGDRVFHYGYVYSVNSTADRAMGGMKNVAAAKAVTFDAVVHAVGDTEIVIEDDASAVNLWAGGYLMPRISSAALGYGKYSSYRVLSNTVTDNTHVTLTLDRGVIVELPASDDGFLNQNMYSKLSCELPNAGVADAPSVGVNLVRAVSSRWIWLQTWGPCYITGGDERLGNGDDQLNAVFHQDGSLYCPATRNQQQDAGFLLNRSGGTSSWYVFLHIAC